MNGGLEIGFDACPRSGQTRLAHLYQQAPLRALFPLCTGMDLPVVVTTSTSGGFAGGDRMAISLQVGAKANAMGTAQAAEKFYRSTGADTEITVLLAAGAGSWLEWLPQESILFNGARLKRRVEITLAEGAEILAGDLLVFGRRARGERIDYGLIHDQWRIRVEGALAWADSFFGEGDDLASALRHPAGLDNAGASALLVHAGPNAAARLDLIRNLLATTNAPVKCAATCVNGILLVRWLADESIDIRPSFARVWTALRAAARNLAPTLPTFWHH
ncbi:MAG TPA: urease accessory protein UreD [Dongiaceae bacterium]|jgi:urease accessory protein|nr:urease accessory protein UreD [Dongiaceae bacterium]